MAFLSEEKATYVATAMAGNLNASIEIDHQVKNDQGEWVSKPDEEQ